DVLLSHISAQGAVGAVGAPQFVHGYPGPLLGPGDDRPDEGVGGLRRAPFRLPGLRDARRDRPYRVTAAADARALVVERVGFDPVDGAQVVQVLRSGSLVAALVGRQQRRPEAGGRLA